MIDYLLGVFDIMLIMGKGLKGMPQVTVFLEMSFEQVFPDGLQLNLVLLQPMHQVTVLRQVKIPHHKDIPHLLLILLPLGRNFPHNHLQTLLLRLGSVVAQVDVLQHEQFAWELAL